MLTLLIAAFILGLVFNATPGPVFAETVRQGVRGGFRSALAVQFGSLVGDALWPVVGRSRVSSGGSPMGTADLSRLRDGVLTVGAVDVAGAVGVTPTVAGHSSAESNHGRALTAAWSRRARVR